jgi:hypothetical protein
MNPAATAISLHWVTPDDNPKVLSPEEQAEVDALRKTIKDTQEQIALANQGSSSREFREDLQILLRDVEAKLDEIIPPSTPPPPA